MKNTKVCPKCGSHDIVIVPAGSGGTIVGDNVHIGFFRPPVGVARHLCGNCGFIEDWIDGPEDIEKIKRKYSQETAI